MQNILDSLLKSPRIEDATSLGMDLADLRAAMSALQIREVRSLLSPLEADT